MGLVEIGWAIGIAAAPLQIGVGVAMTQFSPPNVSGAKALFLGAPVLPLIAIAIWGYIERPSFDVIILVSILVGSPIIIATMELMRWLENKGE
jgi:hypothetical protein